MSEIKFEGDISGITDSQLEFIRSVLEGRGFRDETVTIEAVGQAGDNYVANVKRIIATKDGEKLSMIAKIASNNEALRKAMNTLLMFMNEHVMYTEVLPKFTELEKEANIPVEERLRYAACYGSFTEAANEVILLEDLKESDFTILHRFVSLTDDTVKLVLKNFAILHSLSYALRNQEPETYTAYKSKLLNMWAMMEQFPDSKLYFEALEKDMLELLDNDQHKKQITGTLGQLITHASNCFKIDSESKYSIIQQGDSWTNNIMFRLEDDKTIDCCMIDYQVSKESSPVADIQYMIFNCTDHETRIKHYHEWIDYYHEQLENSLANFNLKVSDVYPRDQLDAELKMYSRLSLSTSALLATVLMREGADASNFKTAIEDSQVVGKQIDDLINAGKMTSLDDKTVSRFKNRIVGLLDSFQELGYL